MLFDIICCKRGVIMSLLNILGDLNKIIIDDFIQIENYLSSGNKTNIVDVNWNAVKRVIYFNDDINKEKSPDLWKAANGRTGVYIFRMINTIDRPAKFDPVTGGSPVNIPKPATFDAGHALYVGKASDSFLSRMHPHFASEPNGTGALKIKHPNRLIVASNIEVYGFLFDKKINSNSWIIAGAIETLMHDKYKPYVGNKRK